MQSAETSRFRSLAPHIISEDGTITPFEEQVAAYAYGEMASGDMFVVSPSASAAGVPEAGDLPILMRQKTMKKVQIDHEISLSEIEKLPEWLKEHPLAMESITERNGLVVVADALDAHGNDIIVAMHLGIMRQQVEIDEVASAYGKENLAYLIANTEKLGRRIFPNERTGDWILRTGLQLPEQIANRLQNHYSGKPAVGQRETQPNQRLNTLTQTHGHSGDAISVRQSGEIKRERAGTRQPDIDRDLRAARESARSQNAERASRGRAIGPDVGNEKGTR